MKTSKITLEILSNRFQAIVDEMAQALFRTAYTVFIKETQDYGTVLVSPEGEVFAASRRYGVLMMIGHPMAEAIRKMGEDVRPGDVFISNDPYETKGMATHLNDIYLWSPIFHEGRLLCYAWTFIHVSDVGGRVAGSIAPSSTELAQEGIRIPPQLFRREGKLDETFLNLFMKNCRSGEDNWGDMKACLVALGTAERRMNEVLERFGGETVSQGIVDVLDYAETQARRVISEVPEGTYIYSDFIEGDAVGLGLLRIKLTLTIKDGAFGMDFSGTAPQVRAALNLPTHSQDGHWTMITGVVNWLCTREPTIAYNAGLVRAMKVHAPEGSLLNPEPGAACGARYSTSHKVCDVIIGALSQAVPDQLPATDAGQAAILLVAMPDMKSAKTRVSVIQPLVGGSGARPMVDGVDGTMVILNFLKNVPTELLEREMPEILIRRYGLREDSGGAGRYRGGTGTVLEFETHAPFTTVTARNMERYKFPPAGRFGGSCGTTGYTRLKRVGGEEEEIGKIDILELNAGDILHLGTQGGGGYGDPLERPAQAVLSDVLDGYVSFDTARNRYGVICDSVGGVDAAATEACRSEQRRTRPSLKPFDFGPVREAYHARWPAALHDALIASLEGLSRVERQILFSALYKEIDRRLDAGEAVAPGDVAGLRDRLREATGGSKRLAEAHLGEGA